MADVFISYSRANQEQVRVLAEAMVREGYDVWWDAELPPHRSYGDVITEEIATAGAVIVVWSQTAAASEWVRAEADLGRNQKKLIQASLDDCMPPMPFNQIQFAYIGDWKGDDAHPGWRKIKASLADLSGRERPARPAIHAMPAAPPPPVAPKRSYTLPLLAGGSVAVALAALFILMNTQKPAAPVKAAAPVEAAAAMPQPRFNLAAVIDDPDGYTNVRAQPSTAAAIVDRVEDGEAFTTFSQDGGWWQVRTADGKLGWMERSRIRTLAARPDARTAGPAPVVAAETAASTPPPASGAGLVLPESSTRRLTRVDLAGLTREQLTLARNEIFARHGRRFARADLRAHFEQFDWYTPVDRPSRLSPIELENVALIGRAEKGL